MEDKGAIKLCLSGRTEAFEILVSKYQHRLYLFILKIINDGDECMDVIQESFIQAYFHLSRFDVNRSFKTWLFSIATKRCIDRLRKRKSFLKYFNHTIQDESKLIQPSPSGLEQSEIFLPLLSRLKSREKVALLLQIEADFSAREIADVLKCSENTVRVHLFNARKKLKKAMALRGGVE